MYSAATKARWVELYTAGASTKKIAADEGVSSRTVLLYLKAAGVRLRAPGRLKQSELSKEEQFRRWWLKSQYDIDHEVYDQMLERQGGVCAICHKPPPERANGGVLHVDHDHATRKVRGLLCRRCNPALGAFDDDPGRLRRAAEYLEKNR